MSENTATGLVLAVWCSSSLIAALVLAWWRRRPTTTAQPVDTDDEVVTAILQVPRIFTDGRPVQPCELLAASHLVAHQVEHLAAGLYAAAMDTILAQAAASEATGGLDQALERITRGGTS